MAGKRYQTAASTIDRNRSYPLAEAVALIKAYPPVKFDESVDLAINLGVDPKHADQMVRGTISLPHGIGKTTRVLVFAKNEKEKEAREAGADFVGGDDLAKKIQEENWFDFDTLVATPDMMVAVGKIGRILGPRGLMPNPKVGTVTVDVAKAVSELKRGRVEFRVEKAGIVQTPIGKASFSPEKLAGNLHALLDTLIRLKPSTSKGTYLRSITISTTHGPGIKVDPASVTAAAAE